MRCPMKEVWWSYQLSAMLLGNVEIYVGYTDYGWIHNFKGLFANSAFSDFYNLPFSKTGFQ